MRGYDILGNIAVVKFARGEKRKKEQAERFLKEHGSVTTVLEKTGRFKGRLRVLKTQYLAGIKTKEVLYRENGCVFRFHIDKCYFSPRLANERLMLAKKISKKEKVLVLFGGVGPFAIVIAKFAKPSRVVSVELSRACQKYAEENVKRNKVNVELIQGDVHKVLPKMREMYDRIIMARPNLQDSFLDVAFQRIKKGMIHYYGFYEEDSLAKLRTLLEVEAKKAKKKIKILRIEKAGDIGAYMYRYRANVKVL